MEVMEMDRLSAEGSPSEDNDLQHNTSCNNGDTADGSTVKLHQLADNDTASKDIMSRETDRSSCTEKLCKIVLLTCITLLVMGVMQIPVTLYATAPSSQGLQSALFNLVDFENCLIDLEIQEEISYDMICHSGMNQSVETLLSSCNDIQASAVTALGIVYNLSNILDSSSCVENGISFFCNSTAVLCGNDSGSSMLNEYCVQVRDNNCAIEWRIAENLLLNVSIPDCSSFDDGANLTFSTTAPAQTCPNDFDLFCNTFCLPVCSELSLYSDTITNFYTIWVIVMFVISITGGIVDFVVFYLKRETMFKYPLIFVVYATVLILILNIFATLPYILGSNLLFCSNDNFFVAVKESTAFCQTQGFIANGGVSVFIVVLLFHILHIFGGVAFPLKSKQLWESNSFKRKAYVIEVFVILICGLLPHVIILSVSEYQFIGYPLLCVPSSEPVLVYILLISNALVVMITLFLLLITFWMIHKNFKQDPENKVHAHGKGILFSIKKFLGSFSIPETKLILLICFYWVANIIWLTAITQGIGESDKLLEDVSTYTSCTAGGIKPECETIRESIQEDLNDNLVISLTAYVVLALVTWFNLFFVIQASDVIALYKYFFGPSRSGSSSNKEK